MTSPRNATTNRDGSRFYTWNGERYPSVTTILQWLAKHGLVGWAKKYTAEFAVAHCGELMANIEIDMVEAIDWLKNSSFRARDVAADIGTDVHTAIEAYILGQPVPEWREAIQPRMLQFERFLSEWHPDYQLAEANVYNRTEGYAGTLDSIALLNGVSVLIDVKTRGGTNYPVSGRTKGAVYSDDALQVAAYRNAEFLALPDGSETPLPHVDACAVLRIDDDGYELIEVRADADAFKAFLSVRDMFRWQDESAKTVLLGRFPATLETAPNMDSPGRRASNASEPALATERGHGEQEPGMGARTPAPTSTERAVA